MTEHTLNDRYKLDDKAGEGGMAVTYRARDLLLNRTVAIKLMREQFTSDPQFVERFRREAQAAARLSHENIASVYDTGRANGSYYIVMEYVEGTDLKQRIRREGTLSVATTLDIAQQIAAALEAAHAGGLVHRDIKPHNVLLNHDGKVKVTDFGIAKIVSETEDTGVIIGSVHYLSPEQARGEATTPSSDIYALGAVMFEMLTGRTVFEGENAMAVTHKQIYEAPPRPRSLRPDIPAAVETVVLRCLEKDPRLRYQSAAELRAVLLRLLGQLTQEATVVIPGPTPAMDATMIYRKPAGDHAPTYPSGTPRQPAPPTSRSGSATGWIIVTLFLMLAGVVVYFAYSIIKPPQTNTPVVTPATNASVVPDLTGLDKDAATELLRNHGLVGQANHEYSNTTDAGKVCRQDPASGTNIDAQKPVFFWVSDGAETFTMPDVTGMSLDAAKREIRKAGYPPDQQFVISKENSDKPLGQVSRTEPVPGTEVDRKIVKITIVVSQGSKIQAHRDTVHETYIPGPAPDLGTDTDFVRIEFERPAGSDAKTMWEGTLKKGDKIPNQPFDRYSDEKVIVRVLAAKDENAPLEKQSEEPFGPNQ